MKSVLISKDKGYLPQFYYFTLNEQLSTKIMRHIQRQVKDTPEKQGSHQEQAHRTARKWQKRHTADQET